MSASSIVPPSGADVSSPIYTVPLVSWSRCSSNFQGEFSIAALNIHTLSVRHTKAEEVKRFSPLSPSIYIYIVRNLYAYSAKFIEIPVSTVDEL